uniref:Uncharacterized protein n=1 Tax=Parascaris equorum TaxID=6256 RepID=A0A914RAG8_PAREQ
MMRNIFVRCLMFLHRERLSHILVHRQANSFAHYMKRDCVLIGLICIGRTSYVMGDMYCNITMRKNL